VSQAADWHWNAGDGTELAKRLQTIYADNDWLVGLTALPRQVLPATASPLVLDGQQSAMSIAAASANVLPRHTHAALAGQFSFSTVRFS
jgi:hypothetical protein